MANKEISKVNPSIKKLKLLVTIVDRSKALFYTDLIEQFEVNMQTVVYGKGTAASEMLSYLGLAEIEKAKNALFFCFAPHFPAVICYKFNNLPMGYRSGL